MSSYVEYFPSSPSLDLFFISFFTSDNNFSLTLRTGESDKMARQRGDGRAHDQRRPDNASQRKVLRWYCEVWLVARDVFGGRCFQPAGIAIGSTERTTGELANKSRDLRWFIDFVSDQRRIECAARRNIDRFVWSHTALAFCRRPSKFTGQLQSLVVDTNDSHALPSPFFVRRQNVI